jgi:hypothetical protein
LEFRRRGGQWIRLRWEEAKQSLIDKAMTDRLRMSANNNTCWCPFA